jgi:serine/threonine-protein kinase ATR
VRNGVYRGKRTAPVGARYLTNKHKLDSIAAELSTNTTQLLQPYWRVIGFSVIRDIINKPQKAQLLADLTEQSVRQLLILTQADTLPHLVLTKRRDIIEKIAQARKASIGEVLTQPRRNLAKILALLLCQPVTDIESNAMETLAAIEPAIQESSNNRLDALIAVDITGVAIEILSLAADQDESKKKIVSFCGNSLYLSFLTPVVPSWVRYTGDACRYEIWAQVRVENQKP